METFVLAVSRQQKVDALEREIAKEKASASSITGNRLKESLADYPLQRGDVPKSRVSLVSRISERVIELLIQSEALGLPHETLEWVLETCDIPPEGLRRLDLQHGA